MAVGRHRRVPGRRCCSSRRGSTSSCCATATRSSACSRSAPPRKRSTATCGSRSRRCARRARIERHRDRAAAPGAAGARPGDRHRAGDAAGAARQVHRRGALAGRHLRRTDGGRTGWQQDSGFRGRRAPRRAAGATRAGAVPDWRGHAPLAARGRAPALFALWTVGIEARLVYLQVIQHADLMARADRQQLRHDQAARPSAARSSTATAACSPTASTPTRSPPIPTEIDEPDAVAAQVCAALDAATRQQRQAMAKSLRRKGQFAYVARQVSPDEARRVAALDAARASRFVKESRRYYPNSELRRTCSATSGSTTSASAASSRRTTRSIRGRDGQGPDPDRRASGTRSSAASSGRPTAGAGARADHRSVPAVHRRARAARGRRGEPRRRRHGDRHGPAHRRDPGARELRRPSTRTPSRRPTTTARRNRAIQDLYEPGSTFKIVTASAALEEGRDHARTISIDCSPGYITFRRPQPIHDTHRYGVLPFTDVIVKSSNVGAIKVGLQARARAARRATSAGSGSARRSRPTSAARTRHRVEPGAARSPARWRRCRWATRSASRRCRWRRRSARSPTAARSCEPRVVRAFIKDGRARRGAAQGAAPHDHVRAPAAHADDDHGAGRRARHGARPRRSTATRSPARPAPPRSSSTAHYSKSDYNASFVGLRAVAQAAR